MEGKAVCFDRKAAIQYLQGFLNLENAKENIGDIDSEEPYMESQKWSKTQHHKKMRTCMIVFAAILGAWTLAFLISYFTLGEGIGGMILGIGGIVLFFILLMVYLGKMVSAKNALQRFLVEYNEFMSEPQKAERAKRRAQEVEKAQAAEKSLAWVENTYQEDVNFLPMRKISGDRYVNMYSFSAFSKMMDYLRDGRAMTLPQAVQRLDTEIMHNEMLIEQMRTQAAVRESAAAVVASQQQMTEQIRRTGKDIESSIDSYHRGY